MVIRVPDSVPMSTAAVLTCGGITAYNAISNARDSLQKNITIFGLSTSYIGYSGKSVDL